jgi:uncharacterized protein YaaR (DUF327 family)
MVSDFYKKINKALNKHCPLKSKKSNSKGNKWFTKSLKALRKKVRKAYDKMKRCRNVQNINKYQNLNKRFKKEGKKARNASWRKYKEEIKDEQEMQKLVKVVEKKQANQVGVMKKEDGTISDVGKDTIEYMLKTHFPHHEVPTAREFSRQAVYCGG